jgi:hypothetical protein
MKEEHKLQIRVRSKTEQRMMEDIDVKMITEWDVKKIVITLCCLLLLIGIMYYFFANEESPEIANKRAKLEEVNKIASSLSQKKTVVVEKSVISEKQQPVVEKVQEVVKVVANKQNITVEKLNVEVIKNNKYVRRGLLAKRAINKEPSGVINLPLVVNKEKAISVTYFTEIVNMQGNSVYHEWVINNKVIYRKKVNVLGDRWRVATRKLFSYSATGEWQVRVVNKKGDILHKIDFLVTK